MVYLRRSAYGHGKCSPWLLALSVACGPEAPSSTSEDSSTVGLTSSTTGTGEIPTSTVATSSDTTSGSSSSGGSSDSTSGRTCGLIENSEPVSPSEQMLVEFCESRSTEEECNAQIGEGCKWIATVLSVECDGRCPSVNSGICAAAPGAETGCTDPCDMYWRSTEDGLHTFYPQSSDLCFVVFIGWQACSEWPRPECNCGCD